MKNNIIHRVISNKNNYRYIAACVFIVAAGIVYSLSRLMSNSGNPEYEYSISTKPSAAQTTELSQEPTTQDKNTYVELLLIPVFTECQRERGYMRQLSSQVVMWKGLI